MRLGTEVTGVAVLGAGTGIAVGALTDGRLIGPAFGFGLTFAGFAWYLRGARTSAGLTVVTWIIDELFINLARTIGFVLLAFGPAAALFSAFGWVGGWVGESAKAVAALVGLVLGIFVSVRVWRPVRTVVRRWGTVLRRRLVVRDWPESERLAMAERGPGWVLGHWWGMVAVAGLMGAIVAVSAVDGGIDTPWASGIGGVVALASLIAFARRRSAPTVRPEMAERSARLG